MRLQLHWAAFLLHSISSILSIIFDTGGQKRQIYIQETTYKRNVSTEITQQSIGAQDVLVWIFINELITALSHAYSLYTYYYTSLNDENAHTFELTRRSWEYTITAAVIPVALVLGVSDIALTDVIFIFVINAVIQWLGMMNLSMPAFLLLSAELSYVSILLYGVDYSVFSASTFYILIGIMYMIFYISFGFVKLANIQRKFIEDDIYIILSVACKISLSWLLISNIYTGYYDLCGTSEVCEMVKKSAFYGDWFAWQIGFLVFGTIGLLWSAYIVYQEKIKYEDYELL